MAARQTTKGRLIPPGSDRGHDVTDDGLERPRRLLTPVPDVAGDDPEVERLRRRVEELGIVAERLRSRALASQREAVLLSEHLTTRGALLGTVRIEADTLRRELDRSRDERDAIGRQRDALASDLQSTRDAIASRESDVAALRAELAEHARSAQDLAIEVAGLRADLDGAHRTRVELSASVTSLTSDLDVERDASASLRAELASALEDIGWQVGETRRAHEATAEAIRRAESAEEQARRAEEEARRAEAAREAAEAASGPTHGRAGIWLSGGGTTAIATADTSAMAASLDRARAETRDATERLGAIEEARDLYRLYLQAVATTGPGRAARQWATFSRDHPRVARLIRAPFAATWRLLTLRWPWWLRQHPLFDRDWYVEVNRDLDATRLPPWWHYVRHGIPEGRAPNRYFDREWYLRTYPDVTLSRMDPLDHYLRFGGWEGRDPSPRFATDWYLAEHPDVVAAGMNALFHFLNWGAGQGYQPRPIAGGGAWHAQPTPFARTAAVEGALDPPARQDPSIGRVPRRRRPLRSTSGG